MFCNDCFDHFLVFIWNDERIIGQRERIIGQRERIIGQRSRNNRENTVEIWNRIIVKFFLNNWLMRTGKAVQSPR